MPHMWTDILRIEVFKALEAAEVKSYIFLNDYILKSLIK